MRTLGHQIYFVSRTDSTIASPQKNTTTFFNERFVADRHKKECHEKVSSKCILVCKGLSNDGVGVASGTVFQEIRPGAGFKTGYFVNEKCGGGGAVERLHAPQAKSGRCRIHLSFFVSKLRICIGRLCYIVTFPPPKKAISVGAPVPFAQAYHASKDFRSTWNRFRWFHIFTVHLVHCRSIIKASRRSVSVLSRSQSAAIFLPPQHCCAFISMLRDSRYDDNRGGTFWLNYFVNDTGDLT